MKREIVTCSRVSMKGIVDYIAAAAHRHREKIGVRKRETKIE